MGSCASTEAIKSESKVTINDSTKKTTVEVDPIYLRMKESNPNFNSKVLMRIVVGSHFEPEYTEMSTYSKVFEITHIEIKYEMKRNELFTQHDRVAKAFLEEMYQFWDEFISCDYNDKKIKSSFLTKIESQSARFNQIIRCCVHGLKSAEHQCQC
jgi:hypothetical protein